MGSFGIGGNVLKLTSCCLCDSVNTLQSTELYPFDGWIRFVNYVFIKPKLKRRWSRKAVEVRKQVAEKTRVSRGILSASHERGRP